jgi:AraC-like DNA-binding protein
VKSSSTLFIYLICFLFGYKIQAQSTITGQQRDNLWNAGIPFITTYPPEEYKGDSQNWGFVQSENGIIYVANSAGVLEFDGANWCLIQTVNSGTVRSLAKDDDGAIYVGGSREIGYLKPDNQGQLHYASLLTELDPEFHNFTDVWSTYLLNGAVYFISPQYIFKWEKNHFKVFRPSKSFATDVLFNEEILVIDGGVGLKILREDTLLMAPLGSSLSSNLKMFPFDDKRILVVDNSEGSFLYDFESYLPLKKGDPLFKEITVTSLDEKFLNDFLALLEEKYNDPAFGVPQMQKELGMSKTHLHSKIKTLTNHPPGELLRIFRLKRAAQLLSQNTGNISQIAYDTGFGSLSHFTKCFKELYDMSPSEYLQKGAE